MSKPLYMEPSADYFIKILDILAPRYTIGCTLEELASLASPVSNVSDTAAAERENQAKLLDGLMWMNDQGYIFLNSDNEKSLII